MTYEVRLAEDAELDLEDIYGYVLGRQSLEAADALLDHLEEVCAGLSSMPGRGSIPPELEDLGISDFRELHASPYRVIFRIFEDGKTVVVYGILDGRQDMQTLFKRRLLRP